MSDERLPDEVLNAESDDESLTIVRIFDAPREEVFKAWTDPERFARWFGEHGSSVPVDAATMDVRPDGAWRAVMIVGPETELVFSGHYREVDEPSHLVRRSPIRSPSTRRPWRCSGSTSRTSATVAHR